MLKRIYKRLVKKRKPREEKWGPTLVDRSRRKQNDGTSML
jgi:hypothetical protein